MKSYIRHLYFFIVIIITLIGCEKEATPTKDTDFFNLKGEVKSFTQSFDYSQSPDNNDSYSKSKRVVNFNQNGMRTTSLWQHIDQGNPSAKPSVSRNEFTYYNDGRLKQQSSYQDFNSALRLDYLYKDGDKQPYASTQTDSNNDSHMNLFKYDAHGNLTSVATTDKNATLISTYDGTFDEKNRPIQFKNSYGEDYQTTIEFSYNSDGFEKQKIVTTQEDKSVLTYEYLKTDDRGNWTERKAITESESGYVIEKRQVTYF